MSILEQIIDHLRGWPILAVALFMLAVAVTNTSISFAVTLYGLGKITGGAYLGYWIDRWTFPYGRPHPADDEDVRLWRSMRRALIVVGGMIAGALVP